MSVQPDPPIQLDPSMDEGHKLTFINQNFLTISNFLKSNSFKISLTGTVSLTVTDPLTTKAKSTATIAHNLGYAPTFLVYANVPTGSSFQNAGQLTQLPTMLIDSIGAGTASGAAFIWMYVQARADSTNLYIDVLNPTSGSQTGFGNPWTFRYYILIETSATT